MTDEKLNETIAKYTLWFVIAIVLLSLLWLGLQLDWIKKTTSITDALALVAVVGAAVVAARTAVVGWGRADRLAQTARDEATQDAQEERGRIAKAECAIFYRRYHSVSLSVATVLANIFINENNPIRELSKQGSMSNDAHLTQHFLTVREAMKRALPVFPDMSDAHGHLSKVYQYNDELGDLMSDTIVKMTEIRGQLKSRIKRTEEDSLEAFKEDPSTAIHAHYALLHCLTAAPILMENIRKVHTNDFSSDIREEVLVNLRLSFQSIFGLKFVASGSVIDSEAFVEIFFKAHDAFGKIGVQAQNHVMDRLSIERRG